MWRREEKYLYRIGLGSGVPEDDAISYASNRMNLFEMCVRVRQISIHRRIELDRFEIQLRIDEIHASIMNGTNGTVWKEARGNCQ